MATTTQQVCIQHNQHTYTHCLSLSRIFNNVNKNLLTYYFNVIYAALLLLQPHTTTATGTATSWLPKTGEGVSTMQETTGTAGQLTEEELLNNYLPTKLLKNELQVALQYVDCS